MFSEAMFGGIYESAALGNNSELDGITLESANLANGLLAEHAIQTMYEFQLNMKNIDAAAVCEEYMYLKENGVEMIAENAWDTIKGWFEKVKEAIIALWKRITEFFKSVFKKIDEFIKNDTLWVKAYTDKVSNISENVELYHPIDNYISDPDTYIENAEHTYALLSAEFGAVKSLDEAKKLIEKGKCKTANDTISYYSDKLGFGKCTTIAEFKKAFDKDEKNSAKETRLTSATKSDIEDAFTFIKTFANTRSKMKKAYDDNKKMINNSLSYVKNYQKSCERNSDEFTVAKSAVTYIQTGLSILTMINSKYVQSANRCRTCCKKLIVEAIKSDKRNKKKEDSTNESTNILGRVELL